MFFFFLISACTKLEKKSRFITVKVQGGFASNSLVVVQDQSGNQLTFQKPEEKSFPTVLKDGDTYTVKIVSAQNISCSLSNAEGVVIGPGIVVEVTCGVEVSLLVSINGNTSANNYFASLSQKPKIQFSNGIIYEVTGAGTYSLGTFAESTFSAQIIQQPAGVFERCLLYDNSGENIKISGEIRAQITLHCKSTQVGSYIPVDSSILALADPGSNRGSASASCTQIRYEDCMPIGMKRVSPKATNSHFLGVGLTGSECSGITAEDNLGFFKWRCEATTPDNTNFYYQIVSYAVNPGKSLSDLIDFTTPSFKQMSLTVYKNGTTLYTTEPAIWWNTNITLANSTPLSIADNTLYVVTQNVTGDYAFTGPAAISEVGIIVQPGRKITGRVIFGSTASPTSMVDSGYFSGEVDVNFQGPNYYGIVVENGQHIKIENAMVYNAINGGGDYGLFINSNAKGVSVLHSRFDHNDYGIGIAGLSQYHTFLDTTVSNAKSNCIQLNNNVTNILFQNTVIAGCGSDAIFVGSNTKDIWLLNTTILNAAAKGLNNSGTNFILQNLLVANVANNGIFHTLPTAGNFSHLEISSAVLNISSNINSVYTTSNGNNITYYGTFRFSANNCNSSGTNVIAEGNGSTCTLPAGQTTATIQSTSASASNQFVTFLSSDDTQNSSDNPTGVSEASISDWSHFENTFRFFSRSNVSTFPDPSQQFYCSSTIGSSTCYVFDARLLSTGTNVLNINPLPQGSGSFEIAFTDSMGNTHNFVLYATEIYGDGIGNDDGLCNPSEECLYTPNIGAYQGHGNLVSASSYTFSGGRGHATIYKYQNNGM
ncbi:MAG: right-handed parallel beta-helix repeat-containing protein [Candidatus Hydrogenedentota bacterium]|nr:MAG: right-handed parallel beta-helix repeat-containing protein [Candidatus Hydrogenedentota bacterium]